MKEKSAFSVKRVVFGMARTGSRGSVICARPLPSLATHESLTLGVSTARSWTDLTVGLRLAASRQKKGGWEKGLLTL